MGKKGKKKIVLKNSTKKKSVNNSKEKLEYKGKNSFQNEELLLKKHLRQQNFTVNSIDPDGNCLFRSLSDCLFGEAEDHFQVRQKIVDYIEQNEEDFQPFLEDEESFEHYCKRMREEGVWGGNQELYAASRLYNVNITIHQLDLPQMRIECMDKSVKKVVHLCYYGQEHYDSVHLEAANIIVPEKQIIQERLEKELNDCKNQHSVEVDRSVTKDSIPHGLPSSPAKSKSLAFDLKRPKRGQPCPCGSSVKYKDCCRRKSSKALDAKSRVAKSDTSHITNEILSISI